MKNIKKTVILLVVVSMIMSSISVTYANTVKFTDINNNWAKQSIINVFNKGLMYGITDTLFKPGDKVTHYQALVSIARMTKAKDKYDLAALETKYKTNVLDKFNVPAYARLEVAYCIEAGIIKAEDVAGFAAAPYISKQIVSYNLARAFGVNYDSQATFVYLGYKDAMYIRAEYKPYVRYLIDLGVIASVGDDKGNFNPTSTITRDVFARMLDVASDKYNEQKPTAPTTPAPTTPTAPTTPITPTVPTTPTPVPTTPAPAVPAPNHTGTVDQVMIEFGAIVFNINNANNTQTKSSLKIADNIVCVIDGVETPYYWKVKTGDKVGIYLNKEGKVSKLVVDSKIKRYTGTVESLLITNNTELTVNVKDIGSKKFYLTGTTKIIKNGGIVKFDAIKAGDKITLTADDVTVLELNADSTLTTDNGIIESIMLTRTTAPKITMVGLDGKNKEYFIRKDLNPNSILIDNRASYVYDLRPGMHIKVELENDEIVKLTTIARETNSKIDGTIKFINKSFKIIVLSQYDINGKEITREISVENSEISNVKLERLTLDGLKEGDKVTVFAVEDAGKLKASLVILNN